MRVRTMRLVELMLAPAHQEAAMADVRRVREIAASVEPLVEGAADRGATGPAALARPRGIETIQDDVWDDARGRHYSRTDVMRFRDGVLEHYAEAGILTGHLLDAAMELARLYRLARATMDVPGAALCQYGEQAGRRPSESQEEFEARVWKDFNRAVDHLPRGSRPACVDVARGLFPTGHDAVHHMRWGFEALAKLWKMTPKLRG
ncbi:hypothetical protein HMPREF9946_02148 [Acetobacteraceae bacterium AT-5844]|nr:hypothetical protein HMPREF9946_02148 [Acetobacteraceae bacterium AT-5844]